MKGDLSSDFNAAKASFLSATHSITGAVDVFAVLSNRLDERFAELATVETTVGAKQIVCDERMKELEMYEEKWQQIEMKMKELEAKIAEWEALEKRIHENASKANHQVTLNVGTHFLFR